MKIAALTLTAALTAAAYFLHALNAAAKSVGGDLRG